MTVKWSRGGPDLLVTLDRGAGALGIQIGDQLRAAIRQQRLAGRERLPSTRHLAGLLGVSRGTIVDVYEQLIAEGYLDSEIGSGTRVAATPTSTLASGGAVDVAPAASGTSRMLEINFEYGIPDLGSVPLADWSWAIAKATKTVRTAELGDEEGAGSHHLREVVTAYHRRVRSGCAIADDAIIVSGFRQGLAFTLATLASNGIHSIALEDPGPRDHKLIARRAGLVPMPVGVDDNGLDVEPLRASGARAVLLTPAHQCPTGVALSAGRRRELIAWADEVDGVILEDDYDAEFRYDRQPVGSLQGLHPDRVIALGSVSKTLAPTFRLGWVLTPRRFRAGILEEKTLSSRGAPGLDQEALALLMETGRFDRHLRQVREIYRARRRVLEIEVDLAFGPGRLTGLAAGCHAVLRLPDARSELTVATEAAALGVRVNPLGAYRFEPADAGAGDEEPSNGYPPALVLGFGNVTEDQIRRGIRSIASVARASAQR